MSIDYALQYAARGWSVFPLYEVRDGVCACGRACGKDGGKHPRVRGGFKSATRDVGKIEEWWGKWPAANVALATGQVSKLLIIDLDSAMGVTLLKELTARFGPLPRTLIAYTARGAHLYFCCGEVVPCSSGGGLDVRGDGGYVAAPPSTHLSGAVYRWDEAPLANAPTWLVRWCQERSQRTAQNVALASESAPVAPPTSPLGAGRPKLAARAQQAFKRVEASIEDVRAALAALPNADLSWDEWNKIGMAAWNATGGNNEGKEALREWSSKSNKHDDADFEKRWAHYFTSPPAELGFGAIVFAVRREAPEWQPPSRVPREINGHALPLQFTQGEKEENPLIKLNKQYAVIGNVGGKCLVMSWGKSDVDEEVLIPSFQGFKAFSEHYANRYVAVTKQTAKGEKEEAAQLGATWLKWSRRKTYPRITLVPGKGEVLPDGALNLWRGFGVVAPVKGVGWPLMRGHVRTVLASGDLGNEAYILRWAAWAVQNPGERAEVALVFRGGKGSGKGTFGHAMRRLFGTHGLHITNSRHLVGTFNAHLRTCCLLFADEAFWAGDKQGESVLKGIITEPTLFIEQKGIDGVPVKNCLKVMMMANAAWVIPASHDERRYVQCDVDNYRIGDRKYFAALHAEMENGGLGAMLRDLLAMDLKGWHPREGHHTEALQKQKMHSMDSKSAWFESLLQQGWLPFTSRERPHVAPASELLASLREFDKRLNATSTSLGLFLREQGCLPWRNNQAKFWQFPPLKELRAEFALRYRGWTFESDEAPDWTTKSM